jgi:prepilin-type N-terminal cleavage/methylation domain-containing protein
MKRRCKERERKHVARSGRDRGSLFGDTRLRGRSLQRGFTITECLVALVLLGAAAALMAQVLGGVVQQRRAADQQSLALLETANLMEQLVAIPYAELTPQRAAELGISELAQHQLPGARLEVSVAPTADDPSGKVVRVSLRWHDRSGRYGAPLQLTAWRYQRERSSP